MSVGPYMYTTRNILCEINQIIYIVIRYMASSTAVSDRSRLCEIDEMDHAHRPATRRRHTTCIL